MLQVCPESENQDKETVEKIAIEENDKDSEVVHDDEVSVHLDARPEEYNMDINQSRTIRSSRNSSAHLRNHTCKYCNNLFSIAMGEFLSGVFACSVHSTVFAS